MVQRRGRGDGRNIVTHQGSALLCKRRGRNSGFVAEPSSAQRSCAALAQLGVCNLVGLAGLESIAAVTFVGPKPKLGLLGEVSERQARPLERLGRIVGVASWMRRDA